MIKINVKKYNLIIHDAQNGMLVFNGNFMIDSKLVELSDSLMQDKVNKKESFLFDGIYKEQTVKTAQLIDNNANIEGNQFIFTDFFKIKERETVNNQNIIKRELCRIFYNKSKDDCMYILSDYADLILKINPDKMYASNVLSALHLIKDDKVVGLFMPVKSNGDDYKLRRINE